MDQKNFFSIKSEIDGYFNCQKKNQKKTKIINMNENFFFEGVGRVKKKKNT